MSTTKFTVEMKDETKMDTPTSCGTHCGQFRNDLVGLSIACGSRLPTIDMSSPRVSNASLIVPMPLVTVEVAARHQMKLKIPPSGHTMANL
jgi:hypothetical protein